MLSYPVRMVPADDGMVIVTFPDVPEARAVGASEEQALGEAPEVLEAALAAYVVEGRAIPSPSDICGAPMVATERFSLLGLELG